MTRQRDKDFILRVGNEVHKQQELNEDDFRLVITKDQIRKNTSRNKVRGVILDEYANNLNNMPGVTASVQGNKVVVNAQSYVNQVFQEQYNSIDDLTKSNSSIENRED